MLKYFIDLISKINELNRSKEIIHRVIFTVINK